MIYAVKILHDTGYVHGNLKLENFRVAINYTNLFFKLTNFRNTRVLNYEYIPETEPYLMEY